MPKLKTAVVKHRIAEKHRGQTAAVAEAAGIPYGSLRNAVAGCDPLSLTRIYDLARVLELPVHDLIDEGSKDDGVPTEPPAQPKAPKKDPGRGPKDPKGPKRQPAESVRS